MTSLRVVRWWSSWGRERERWEGMGEIIMRNFDLTEFHVQVNWTFPMRQVWITIWRVIAPIRGLPNPIRRVIPLISHSRSDSPHHSHRHPLTLSFLSTTLPPSGNTKLGHPSPLLRFMIMSSCTVPHKLSTAYTQFSTHQVQLPPKFDCLPFILTITSCPQNGVCASTAPPYAIDCHQPALHDSSKINSHCHFLTVAS